jgi:hypothetical protein
MTITETLLMILAITVFVITLFFGRRFISPVFLVSLGLFVFVCWQTGGVGPCGPSHGLFMYLIGYPISVIGMLVGLVLSAIKTYKYLQYGPDKKPEK